MANDGRVKPMVGGERVHVPLLFLWRGKTNAGVPPNTWTHFRKVISWKPGQSSRILFAADPTARLSINGTVVVVRVMRFVSPQITVESVDLKPYLKRGRNVVTVLHHFWGVPTFQRSSHGQAGIGFDAGGLLGGVEGWFWRQADEFLPHPHQTRGGGYGRIRFPVVADLRKVDRASERDWKPARATSHPEWIHPVMKETAALARKRVFPVVEVAAGDVKAPSLKTCPAPKAPMSWLARNSHYRVNGSRVQNLPALFSDSPATARLMPGGEGYVTLDFGQPVHGTLFLEILDAPGGAVLDFTYGETRVDLRTGNKMLREDGSFDPELVCGGPYGDRVILRRGKQTIELPDERTCRWMMITWRKVEAPIKIKSISVMTSQHPAPGRGTFSCAVPEVASLVRLGLVHARITMSDTYVDTPGREDAQWLEDIQYRARLSAQWFGDTALRQVTLRHTVEQQRPDGLFRVFPPEEVRPGGITHLDWALTWIGLLRDDWWWTGSLERVEKYFPALERFLAAVLAHTGGDGLFDKGEFFSDIRTATRADLAAGGRESLTNAWLYGFLRQAVEMAAALGRVDAAEMWRERSDRIKSFFPRFRMALGDGGPAIGEIWTPDSGASSPGQAAVVNAVYHGLVDKAEARSLLSAAFLKPSGIPPKGVHPWNNPTYSYRALRTLSDHGMGRVAGQHFLEMYRPYLPDGPLPEYFLMGEGQQDDPTGSHGWAAVPLVWLHDTVLGIRPARPGGSELLWEPCYTGWDIVSGRTMTPLGQCKAVIDWKERRASLQLPKGVVCHARFGRTTRVLSGPGNREIRWQP